MPARIPNSVTQAGAGSRAYPTFFSSQAMFSPSTVMVRMPSALRAAKTWLMRQTQLPPRLGLPLNLERAVQLLRSRTAHWEGAGLPHGAGHAGIRMFAPFG
jgi:hypothetical protein